jgi:hypothetical protein
MQQQERRPKGRNPPVEMAALATRSLLSAVLVALLLGAPALADPGDDPVLWDEAVAPDRILTGGRGTSEMLRLEPSGGLAAPASSGEARVAQTGEGPAAVGSEPPRAEPAEDGGVDTAADFPTAEPATRVRLTTTENASTNGGADSLAYTGLELLPLATVGAGLLLLGAVGRPRRDTC